MKEPIDEDADTYEYAEGQKGSNGGQEYSEEQEYTEGQNVHSEGQFEDDERGEGQNETNEVPDQTMEDENTNQTINVPDDAAEGQYENQEQVTEGHEEDHSEVTEGHVENQKVTTEGFPSFIPEPLTSNDAGSSDKENPTENYSSPKQVIDLKGIKPEFGPQYSWEQIMNQKNSSDGQTKNSNELRVLEPEGKRNIVTRF